MKIGNYAHIPNHVMVCKYAPVEIKQTLAAKKKLHAEQKQKLQRGSQRTFFSNVWTRVSSPIFIQLILSHLDSNTIFLLSNFIKCSKHSF